VFRSSRALVAVGFLPAVVLTVFGVSQANAALPSNCAEAGTTVTCTYSSAGTEGTFAVPLGVGSLHVVAAGGGGGGSLGGSGGAGAQVSTNLTVFPGSTLFVEVGIGGGAFGSGDAGTGGGESDVRTCSISDVSCPAVGTAQDPRLVVAGGGGGAGSAAGGGSGGAAGTGAVIPCNAGSNGTAANLGNVGDGGDGGGCSGGGAGGTSGSGGVNGTAGTASSGGAGGGPRGGGGGAGYFGGGGGGSCGSTGACNGGGGGGGSSFGPTGSVFTTASTGASVAISYVAAAAQVGPSSLSFSAQPQATVSAPRTVTITNTGPGQLVVTGATFAGTDPQDYLVTSNGCLGQIASNASCTIGVSFAPQEQGPSNASLQIASSDPASPASVSLSGTGGSLPQGPPGAAGATGATGAKGETGAKGPAGKIELVTCTTVTKTTTKNGRKVAVKVKKCSTRLVSGPVKFTAANGHIGASLARGRVVYATGRAIATGSGQWTLVLKGDKPLSPGQYRLTLRGREKGRTVTYRRSVTIT
jgi:centrosomal CEP192-like protein